MNKIEKVTDLLSKTMCFLLIIVGLLFSTIMLVAQWWYLFYAGFGWGQLLVALMISLFVIFTFWFQLKFNVFIKINKI